MTTQTISTLRHILDTRVDNAESHEEFLAWHSARAIIEYALADNTKALEQYDYLLTNEEQDALATLHRILQHK